jgi:hypothetical protein
LNDSDSGGGSGEGSRTTYTKNCRNILYNVIKKFKIHSMLDAPCGSLAWMPLLLDNITNEIPDFRYHGVDVVESIIKLSRERYSNRKWQLSLLDITSQDLPDNYDLIFSRDALQHLPLTKVVDALKIISKTSGSRYFLVGSYLKSGKNFNIKIGNYFPIDLKKYPFNLDKYIEIFDEETAHLKYLVLYDIQNYLKFVNYSLIYSNINKLIKN